MRTILITGATSGIGEACAKELIKDHQLILCGRRTERLRQLQEVLSKTNPVYTLSFSVENKTEVENAIYNLPSKWKNIDVLINNAGNAHGRNDFDSGDLEDYDKMIDMNVKGMIYVTKALLPKLKESNHAQIINLSSIAGKETYANGNVYCASKSAVESLSKGMRIDLSKFGIKVSNVAPGAVNTEFSLVRFKGDKQKADEVYNGFEPLKAEDISSSIGFIIRQPEHVQIADITIFPKAQFSAAGITKN